MQEIAMGLACWSSTFPGMITNVAGNRDALHRISEKLATRGVSLQLLRQFVTWVDVRWVGGNPRLSTGQFSIFSAT